MAESKALFKNVGDTAYSEMELERDLRTREQEKSTGARTPRSLPSSVTSTVTEDKTQYRVDSNPGPPHLTGWLERSNMK
jgi:protein required for attachment to host cells